METRQAHINQKDSEYILFSYYFFVKKDFNKMYFNKVQAQENHMNSCL